MRSDLWKFFVGETISNFGTSITQFALPLIVFKLSGSAVALGATAAMFTVPHLLFGLAIGAWTDRTDRKRLMDRRRDLGPRVGYAAIGVVTFVIALAFRVASPLGRAERYLVPPAV